MDRLGAYRPARKDVLAALAFAVVWFGAIWVGSQVGWWYATPRATWNVAGATTAGVLLFREVAPRLVFWPVVLVYPVAHSWLYLGRDHYLGLVSEFHLMPIALVAWTVAARGRLRTWLVLLMTWVATGALYVGYSGLTALSFSLSTDRYVVDYSTLAVLEVTMGAIVVAGRAVYRQELAARQARRRSELLRRAETQQLVAAERTRIARELHDLVAHHVSAAVIRAQAADRVADDRPEELRAAVRWIAANGQETLTAMRHVVRVLRSTDEGAALTPQATLAELPGIAARMAAVGLPVSLVQPESLPPLPAAVELAAVRIVQEALTNVLVHARATRAVVELRPGSGALRVEIHDDGTARREPATTRGNGLIGMRERAVATGGSLRIATSPLGGWMVAALLGVP